MVKIFLYFLSVVILLVGCSHQGKKNQSYATKGQVISIGFFKIPVHGKAKVKRRALASNESIPGAEDFYRALKEYNFAYGVEQPVGFEVTRENYEAQPENSGDKPKEVEKTVYLKQTNFGVFSLWGDNKEPWLLTLKESDTRYFKNKDLTMQILNTFYKEVKRISPSEFVLVMKEEGFICETKIDLKKSEAVSNDHTCKDDKGNLIISEKFLSIKPINVSDYTEKLKSKKLMVSPSALSQICAQDRHIRGTEEDPIEDCWLSVHDGEEKDWSYILK